MTEVLSHRGRMKATRIGFDFTACTCKGGHFRIMPPNYRSCTQTPVRLKNICRICHASEPSNPYPERHHKYNRVKRLKACPNNVSITGWGGSTQYTNLRNDVKRIYPSISAHEERLERIKRNQERLNEIDTMSSSSKEFYERYKRRLGKTSTQEQTSRQSKRRRKYETAMKHDKDSTQQEILSTRRKRRRKLAAALKLCAIL